MLDLCFVSPQTLGHLEKAVVLELTLKHLNALTAVTEQQHQKIVALQNGKMNKRDRFQWGCLTLVLCKLIHSYPTVRNRNVRK